MDQEALGTTKVKKHCFHTVSSVWLTGQYLSCRETGVHAQETDSGTGIANRGRHRDK